jgi:hypothetical protein
MLCELRMLSDGELDVYLSSVGGVVKSRRYGLSINLVFWKQDILK